MLDLNHFKQKKLVPIIPRHSSASVGSSDSESSHERKGMSLLSRSKRPAGQDSPSTPSTRRNQSTLAFDNSMNLVRRTPSGQQIPIEQGLAIYANEGDDFYDGPEQLEDDSMIGNAAVDGEEDDDLFNKAFGHGKTKQDVDNNSEDEYDSDDTRGVGSRLSAKKTPPTSDMVVVKDEGDDEHEEGCNGSVGAFTPPPTPKVGTSSSSTTPVVPDNGNNTVMKAESIPSAKATRPAEPKEKEGRPQVDQSEALKYHAAFHARILPLKPSLMLASHRFWIAVLPPDRKPQNAKEEKHFTWMKGNRLTTVATVWHTFKATLQIDDFVLLLGGVEPVDFKDKCEDLDQFNDKFVLFRAVDKHDPLAKPKEVGRDCPPPEREVVDLTDD